MDEELTNEWQKLSITEEEDRVIGGEEDDEREGVDNRIALSLVGKLHSNKPFHPGALRRTMNAIWKTMEGCDIRSLDSNLFIFQFFNLKDKERVLEGRPWSFDNHLLILEETTGDVQPSKISFSSSLFWIRVYDIPLNKRIEATAKGIGETMGKFLQFHIDDPWDRAMRVKVEVDVSKPLLRGIRIATGKGSSCRVYFKYELLPSFCYVCGLLGHVNKDCLDGEGTGEDEIGFRYGAWLRASPRT